MNVLIDEPKTKNQHEGFWELWYSQYLRCVTARCATKTSSLSGWRAQHEDTVGKMWSLLMNGPHANQAIIFLNKPDFFCYWRKPAYFCPIRGVVSSSMVSDTSWSPERSIAGADCWLLLQSFKLLFSLARLSIITTALSEMIIQLELYIILCKFIMTGW